MELAFPIKGSDSFLMKAGYSLLDEYRVAVAKAAFCADKDVLDIATGSGRMAYTLCSAGYNVVTGDIDESVLGKTITKIGHLFPGRLSFTVLDVFNLPYYDKSNSSVVSANSLHELDNPMKAIEEMTRIVSADGILLLMDFNENGFKMIGEARREMFGEEHRRGTAEYNLVTDYLKTQFKSVDTFDLKLDYVWISKGRVC